jgi:hypothetical protein
VLIFPGNTLANVPSNAIARADSPDSTICDSTHRRCTSTKRSLPNPWLQLGQGFRDRYARIGLGLLGVDPERQPPGASQAKSGVTIGIRCPPQASALSGQHSALGKIQEDVHHRCRWLVLEREYPKSSLADIDPTVLISINIALTLLVVSVHQPLLLSPRHRAAHVGVLVCNHQAPLTHVQPACMLAIGHLVGDCLYHQLRTLSSRHTDMAHLL